MKTDTNGKIKIVTIVGARPQFIKAAAVSCAIAKCEGIEEIIVHTGQHFDDNMSAVFFDELNIPTPKYNLGIGSLPHGAMTGRQLEGIEKILIAEKPDWLLVYGDTNSTAAGALAASKMLIPVAHVEAGLRSFNKAMPEEQNRIITDHLSSLLFAPTSAAVKHLQHEGIVGSHVEMVGDVMNDAAILFGKKATAPQSFLDSGFEVGSFVLATVHRPSTTDDPQKLIEVLHGFIGANVKIILPVHPRTRAKLTEINFEFGENIRLVEPASYLEMLWLEANCSIIVTDSGGVQKEAFFNKKPCITLREETEWMETVELGWNTLCKIDRKAIAKLMTTVGAPLTYSNVYGDGHATTKIVASILAHSR